MKRGNNHRKIKVDHVLLRTGGLIRTMLTYNEYGDHVQAIIELLDGSVVTKHLLKVDGTWQMTFDVRTLRRGKQELRVLFFSSVIKDSKAFDVLQEMHVKDNISPQSQMNAFIEAWCAGEEDKANEIIQ